MPLKLAIVGRPNVGKSTLFNRLAGKKLAIVDDQPGVTRDRKFAAGRLGDLDLELIDTAGFENVSDESLEARMRAQTERAIEEADVALFVVDAREGVTHMDEVFAEVLRRHDRPVVLAANKAESRESGTGVMEAFRLGLGEPVAISAEHGEGMADLYAALLAVAPEEDEDEADEADKPVRIAIVGRPNAGKSTLVNRLIGEDRLLTGPEAGITRDSIPVDWEHDGRRVRLVDTAGLRRKAKVQEKLEKLSTQDTIRAITFAEVVLLVMDATHPFEIQDLQIADLVEREGRGLVFVLTKWDLIEDPQTRLAELIDEAQRQLPQVRGAPIIALSAETGRGLDRLMPAVFKTYGDWSTKVKTRDLNDWLQMAIQRHPPPSVNGRRIKPKYMAQTKARPPTFVMFASRADQLPESYRRYLINSLRESFDLPGVPLRVTIRSSRNPFVDGDEAPAEKRSAPRAKAPAASTGPKPAAKPKPKAKPKAGTPRGRTQKLSRPGVKPKRATRATSSSPRRPR
ncbi:ribosome biogenesis GTPase Der [Phenylobacterium deserti]|uniref:GTPase Der n=1 Tax=Phenylobacterium deserti TaxID=1914756 RepID=A0A328ACB4_9CAUL|nr:ribosome biogenesis GTPase Der [Phenylobacterium deserti]RAK52245.1 ribosome biogenesis GTPase Der [Phenylobacterium deserti]